MTEIIFELGINLIETFIIIDFLTRYLGCKYHDKRRVIGFMLGWMTSFAVLCIFNKIIIFDGIAVFAYVAITFSYALIFLKGSILSKLWFSSLIEIIALGIAVGTNLTVCQITDYDPSDMITVFNSTRIISVIITKIILFYVSRVLLKHPHKSKMDNMSWVMLILIPLISVFSLSALMLAALDHDDIMGYILCGMSGILAANIITYYLFTALNKSHEAELRLKLLEQNNENSKKEIENSIAFIHQMKSVRHNIKNQLITINNYISREKYSEAQEYIKTLTNVYLPNVQDFINTDNEAFNSIINSKIAICDQKKIYIDVNEMKDSLKNLNSADTVILFGNLIDNAIEAAEKTDIRRINVDIRRRGCYLSILVTNSIKDSVLTVNRDLKTSKKDKELHGLGIKSISQIVRKYNGILQFFEENDEFGCHILLDMTDPYS